MMVNEIMGQFKNLCNKTKQVKELGEKLNT